MPDEPQAGLFDDGDGAAGPQRALPDGSQGGAAGRRREHDPAPRAADDVNADADAPAAPDAPLAERLRPRTLDEVVGQAHLLAPGQPLRRALEGGRVPSIILWGPPGVGKTTLARLLARAAGARIVSLSAVLSGVKDIRDAVAAAQVARAAGRATVVFVDEVHRFNKAQQDAFLPHVESGLFTFIGATTENPSFEVNAALLSRASVQVLRPLDDTALGLLVDRAAALLGLPPIAGDARAGLVGHADGDARRLLNAVEAVAALYGSGTGVATDAAVPPAPGAATIDTALVERALGAKLRRFDKGGDQFYDMISALHKSVRGSDPDAALYWLARMLDGGADGRYAARRLVRMASEDIGLAEPRALAMAIDAAQAFDRLGAPEGELMLAQVAVFLAVAPKSDAVYTAWKAARAQVAGEGTREVPPHLRNAPTTLMKSLGHGAGYRHAHDEPEAYAAGEHYGPDRAPLPRWYVPIPRGLEAGIGTAMARRRALDRAALDDGGSAAPADSDRGPDDACGPAQGTPAAGDGSPPGPPLPPRTDC